MTNDPIYDDLTSAEQAQLRALWERRIEDLVGKLRMDQVLMARGLPFAELDGEGNVVIHEPATNPDP